MAVAPVYGGERRRHRTWPRMRMSTNRKMYGFHTARCRVKRENSRIRLVEVEQQNNRRTAHNAEWITIWMDGLNGRFFSLEFPASSDEYFYKSKRTSRIACDCVRLCVCLPERERERELARWYAQENAIAIINGLQRISCSESSDVFTLLHTQIFTQRKAYQPHDDEAFRAVWRCSVSWRAMKFTRE